MDELEESILTRNLPGKYSRWTEEHDDRYHAQDQPSEEEEFVDDGCEEDAWVPPALQDDAPGSVDRVLRSDVPEHIKERILRERGRKHNTGVKAVLADYKSEQAIKRAEFEYKIHEREAILRRIAVGAKAEPSTGEMIVPSANQDSECDSDDSDDSFMREFRARRLAEMVSSSSLPIFGSVHDITSDTLITNVETPDPRTVVLVHLFSPSVSSCVRMNRILDELAPAWHTVKICRIDGDRNDLGLDRATLPIISIYKKGEVADVCAGIAMELGEFFTRSDVEWLLEPRIA